METCYKMPMEDFLKMGFGWVVRSAFVEYKRPLGLGDIFTVQTGIETINSKGCRVKFEIKINKTGKIACDGWFDYVMINITDGKSVKVSDQMISNYSISLYFSGPFQLIHHKNRQYRVPLPLPVAE
jgi:acyl-CoA thioester hydrolase/thioesterase-3